MIHFAVGLLTRLLRKQPIEHAVIGFIGSAIAVLLNITLVVAILGFFGVETTSIAALLAAAGIAIGTANPYRRVDLVAQLHHTVDTKAAIHLLKERLGKISNVLQTPAPDVEILQFTSLGPVLAVRPYCHNQHYWQVYFDTNRVIRDAFGEAGYPAPEQYVMMRSAAQVEMWKQKTWQSPFYWAAFVMQGEWK